tara:strand:+ start:172 stop:663 length:492 start_codon:yes stop_codon:yes gene_type:complete
LSKITGEFDKLALPRAGLVRRMAALLYDSFLVFAIWMLLGFIFQLFTGIGHTQITDGQLETNPYLSNLLFSFMIFSCVSFYCWFWLKSGQTLGMLAWRLRLETTSGNSLKTKQVLVRWLVSWPSFLFLGLGYLWLYIDRNGDTLHDKLSGTKVILIPKSERPF